MSLVVSVPSLAISFSVYGTIKHKLTSMSYVVPGVVKIDHGRHKNLTALGSSLAGAVSGVCASLILFPADVVRRRLQVAGGPGISPVHKLAKIIRLDGVGGLYRGILPEVLKVAPMVGIQFTVYEAVILRLGGLQGSSAMR
jgi:Mitochondrial carrier protein